MRLLYFSILIAWLAGCGTKPKPSSGPLVVEIRPEVVRTKDGGIALRLLTNLPDGTQLKASSTELPALRECSVVRDRCEFAPWTPDAVTHNLPSIEVAIHADFGLEHQSELVFERVGYLGANLRGPLVVTSPVQTDGVTLSLRARVPVDGS